MERSVNDCYDDLWGAGVDVPSAATVAADMRQLDAATAALAHQGYDPSFGARPLER
ncbi:MAG TPA: hypothetical protein VFH30_08030 [Acidimicrobiales bacterium]|jgi:hypothetical protein|nr:hypothetical protein [Acidimicrobiales bacterium]